MFFVIASDPVPPWRDGRAKQSLVKREVLETRDCFVATLLAMTGADEVS
ncbi:MAG: hypothetical protein PHR36_04160 [Patescibacteria group bacterium]|nr:hypothetical protein [Patescibacteria group bacterium]